MSIDHKLNPFVYRLEATHALKPGRNILHVEVANVWRNRMLVDLYLPEDERHAVYSKADLRKGEALTPSGLMGPVRIEQLER